MRIGKVAAQAGVNVQTVRFYERRGLLRQPRRLPSGYRDYPAETVQMVRFIKHFQEHGFTLSEIARLQPLLHEQQLKLPELRRHLETKLHNLETQIESLQTIREKLKTLHARLSTQSPQLSLHELLPFEASSIKPEPERA
jgi:DNA-binding transcriptional MerR regulator